MWLLFLFYYDRIITIADIGGVLKLDIIHHEKGRDSLYKIWNSVDEYMIIYIYTEGGSIVFQDKIYPMERGTLCLVGADLQHYTMPENVFEYDRSKIWVSKEVMRGILNIFGQEESFYRLFSSNSVVYAKIPYEHMEDVEKIYQEIYSTYKTNKKDMDIFYCGFFNLMTYLKKYLIQQTPKQENYMLKAIEYINQNYQIDITLDEICRQVHMSKYYFCRKFKSIMGVTVMDYILKTRIAAAKKLLTTTDYSISDISSRCGFSSVSYFCQIFKSDTKITAMQYRKEVKY